MLNTTAVALAAVLAIGIALFFQSEISPVVYDSPPLVQLVKNDKLSVVEHIGLGELGGAESFAKLGDEFLFASLSDGRIVRLDSDLNATTLIRTGEDHASCGKGGPGDSTSTEVICGRPLGMRLVRRKALVGGPGDEDALIVADAYKGLLMVTGLRPGQEPKKQLLLDRCGDSPRKLKLLNDLAVGPDGTIYMTETSSKFDRRRIFNAVLDGHADGRVYALTPKGDGSLECEVLADDIFMANGVTLSHDKNALMVVSGVRLLQIPLKGNDRGVKRAVSPTPSGALPGTGDNIRTFHETPSGEKKNCYWIGLGSKYAEPFNLIYAVRNLPMVRALIGALVPYITVVELIPKYGMFAVLSEEGEVLETYQDPTGRTPWLSEIEDFGDYIIMGSWYNQYLTVVKRGALDA
mmetsp:Transcript_9412/g.27652  ORF Transcript_9412/g.27652 Transcript_9412/m.27652 type:complete len:407 (-) Transcript_9412:143-1363(-)|eukprot:CAMPEP_0118863434 /NCGR_PEP_ID=MMETSP1163-20130328/8311_1 /TAXON_ID=124430 /ORGANISM="Phaeomonas parva, Strain CCMP2877" /LENGTH=406 /DNA_ID=CAMNT_0006797439 /DNA_START=24 /DNA_END=1244 /DNA_ORIENTATION=+